MKKYIYLLAAMCCLAACEKPIEFEIEETEPLVVVNSVMQADSGFTARVTLSRFFLDETKFKVVNDATLALTINGTPAGPATFGNGRYTIACSPQPGDTVHLDVSVPGKAPVSAGTRIPYKPQLSGLKLLSERDLDCYDRELTFSVVLQDRPSESVGYLLSANMVDTIDFDTIVEPRIDYIYNGREYVPDTLGWDTILPHQEVRNYTLYLESDDPLLSSGVGLDDIEDIFDFKAHSAKGGGERKFMFLDDAISGQKHEFLLKSSFFYYDYDYAFDEKSPDGGVHHRTLIVNVTALSRDLYLYMKTKEQSDDALEIFTEPVQIHCNVVGGIGILGSMSAAEIKKNIDEKK